MIGIPYDEKLVLKATTSAAKSSTANKQTQPAKVEVISA
jgi:hypothetical protein